MDNNEKKAREMMDSLGRMALVLNCKAVAEMIKEKEDEGALMGLAASLVGAASLICGPCEGKELFAKITGALDAVFEKIVEKQKAEMAKAEAEGKTETEEPAPSSAPAQEAAPEPEESTIPEFKGMSQEEIAASMERIFNTK